MAVISTDTFNALRRYVGVRLQQGVPIVDADWNELEDIRKFELRAYLKWYVGNGVPAGNDAFRVEATGLNNDFVIQAGHAPAPGGATNAEIGLGFVGRCLVDGLDVTIENNVNFAAQPLHASQGGAAALAATLSVPQIAALTTPAADGSVTVYLDVWERLITPAEDATLVLTGLGVESCARTKREWVVRVRSGANAPVRGDPDHINTHGYYALATLARRNGDAHVNAADVTDLRETQLKLLPETLATDVLGISPDDYRRGRNRPVVSIRAAVNAVLRGDLPAGDQQLLSSGPPNNFATRASLVDASGNLWAFFTSNRAGNNNILLRRFFAGTRTWGPDEVIVTDPADDSDPVAIVDAGGDILLSWISTRGGTNPNIWMKRFRATTAAWDADTLFTSSAEPNLQHVIVRDPTDNLWVFWMSQRAVGNRPSIWTRRFDRPTSSWGPDTSLIATAGSETRPSTVVDSTGVVFLIWESQSGAAATARIFWNRVNAAGLVGANQQIIAASPNEEHEPFLLIDRTDQVWAFWRAQIAGVFQIQAARFNRVANTWVAEPNLTSGAANNFTPKALVDSLGNVWVLWRAQRGGQFVLLYRIFNSATGSWGPERAITPSPGNGLVLTGAINTAAGAVHVNWTAVLPGPAQQAMFRQFFPSI